MRGFRSDCVGGVNCRQVMEVRQKSTTTVRPARPTPRKSLWCSDLDMISPRTHTPTVYFYRPNGSSTGATTFFDSGMLKSALSEMLVLFYPAAGRLCLGADGRLEIDCNGEGAVFVEAESDVGLDEFGDFGPENDPKFMLLVPQRADFTREHDISACPLLLLQVTRFRCGAASLGVAIDHLLADGFAALHMINSWAGITCGVGGGAVPVTLPFLDRTVLAARDPPAPSFPHHEFGPPTPTLKMPSPPTTHVQPSPLVAPTRFRLTPAQIDRLKFAAGRCSTYPAVAAHAWRCACVARQLPADQNSRLYMPVSFLRRLKPPIPSSYLGNAIIRAFCESTAGEVVKGSIEQVAGRVQATLARIDDAYARSLLDYLQLLPDRSKQGVDPNLFGSPNLSVNSWVPLPIYDADFGWGRPVFMGPTRCPYEGRVLILPRPSADDGLSLIVGLHPEAMERFKKVFYEF